MATIYDVSDDFDPSEVVTLDDSNRIMTVTLMSSVAVQRVTKGQRDLLQGGCLIPTHPLGRRSHPSFLPSRCCTVRTVESPFKALLRQRNAFRSEESGPQGQKETSHGDSTARGRSENGVLNKCEKKLTLVNDSSASAQSGRGDLQVTKWINKRRQMNEDGAATGVCVPHAHTHTQVGNLVISHYYAQHLSHLSCCIYRSGAASSRST